MVPKAQNLCFGKKLLETLKLCFLNPHTNFNPRVKEKTLKNNWAERRNSFPDPVGKENVGKIPPRGAIPGNLGNL